MKRLRRGFTLTELLVAIGIIAVLCAVLLPVFFAVRKKGYQTTCASNLRQLAAASLMYAQDSDGVLPHDLMGRTEDDWFGEIAPYVKNKQVFTCPACIVPDNVPLGEPVRGYGANGNINQSFTQVREGDVRFPTATVLFTEIHFLQRVGMEAATRHSVIGPDFIGADGHGPGYVLDSEVTIAGLPGAVRHNGGSNYVFVDGHVLWLKPEAVDWREHDENGYDLPPPNGTHPSFRL